MDGQLVDVIKQFLKTYTVWLQHVCDPLQVRPHKTNVRVLFINMLICVQDVL